MVWLKIDQEKASGFLDTTVIELVGVKRNKPSFVYEGVECNNVYIVIKGKEGGIVIFETNVNGFAEKLAEALTWEIIFSRDNKDILDFNKMFLALFKAIYKEDVGDGESGKN